MSLLTTLESGDYWRMRDDEAVELFGREFAMEMDHLRKATPTVEAASVPAKGCLRGEDLTPSRHLFDRDYPEVNRTLVSMLAVRWIMNDDYAAFAGCQKENIMLSKQSWKDLRTTFKNLLVTPNDTQALLVATVVSDIGKDAKLEDDPKLLHSPILDSDEKANHDEIAFLASESHLVPSVNSLNEIDERDVMLGLQLATKLNVAQLAQGENVPGSLTPIFAMRGHRRAFNLKMAEIILDVAGAGAHSETRCAQQMTESTFRTYHTTIQALSDLLDGKLADEKECYDQVLKAKAETLQSLGFRFLSPTVSEERVLLRLLSMGRVSDLDMAETFLDAFKKVLANGHDLLVPRLNASGMSVDDAAVLPYYAPALCASTLSSSRGNRPGLTGALAAFMRLLCRACDPTRFNTRIGRLVHELDLRFASDTIKSEEFKENPHLLDNVEIPHSSSSVP